MSDLPATSRPRRRERPFLLSDGTPATGWQPARRGRRLAACALDTLLFTVTVGVGWALWTARLAGGSTTPGNRALGLTVFATDTRRPATRARMLLRGLVYQPLAVLLGIVTLGLGWLYVVAGVAGEQRRTIYDEWAQVVVLAAPAGA